MIIAKSLDNGAVSVQFQVGGRSVEVTTSGEIVKVGEKERNGPFYKFGWEEEDGADPVDP